ncbi:squalene synthase-like [Glandiceps talaboti]
MDFVRSFIHPDEVYALLKYKLGGCNSVMPKLDHKSMSPTAKQCYIYLNQTSRSFAAVIQALDGHLRHAVCIFYLVLRALDTVEDDMTIPLEKKIPMLKEFHKHLYEPAWNFTESKEKDKAVLEDFPTISAEFRTLAPVFQDVIADICKRMGVGMTVFMEREVMTNADWNEYCHYVAGLVGIGLSKLFSASQFEDEVIGEDTELSNSMGLFLQKTNIIRDYLEDINDGRKFWPRETWSKYGENLEDFKESKNFEKSVHCLNDLVTNALDHVPDVLKYMSRIKNQSIFNFCAIPQVMAIATLACCYDNQNVFTSVVKIRKGQAVGLMMEATTMDSIKLIMYNYTKEIQKRIPSGDPSAVRTRQITSEILKLSQTDKQSSCNVYLPIYVSGAMLAGAIIYQYWTNVIQVYDDYI